MRVCDVEGNREGVDTVTFTRGEEFAPEDPDGKSYPYVSLTLDLCAECLAACETLGVVRAIRTRGSNRHMPPAP